MINPSTIDLKALPWLPLEEKTAFPRRPAIYFAIDSLGNVQYIGRAKNVHSRWGKHHKYQALSAIADIKIAYLFIDTPELLPDIEQALIGYFDPPLNIATGRPRRTRPYDRVNYKLDSATRRLLTAMSERKGRNEGAQVEQLILQGEALDRLIVKKEPITFQAVEAEIAVVREEIDNDQPIDS